MKPECIRCGSELVHCFHHTFSFFKKVIRLTQIQEVENRLHLLPGGTDFTGALYGSHFECLLSTIDDASFYPI